MSMKKNLFLRLCLILVVTLTIYSCRTDHFHENETYNNNSKFQLTSKRISLNESKHKSVLVPELEKAKTAFKNSKTNANGRVIDYGNGVSIDTDDVIYIENGPNYHTYTFHIKKENAPADAPLENLLLVPLSDGNYKEFLITYNLTIAEKESLKAGLPVNTNGKSQVTPLENGTFNGGSQLARQVCTTSSYSYWAPCSENKHDGSNYEECTFFTNPKNGTPPINYTIVTTTCLEQNEMIITPVDTGGSGGGGGPGGTYTPPANNNPPCTGTTIPTNPQPGFTDENGCPIGAPSLPNYPTKNDPCQKTKALLENPEVQTNVNALKEQSKIKAGQPNYGEKAFEANNDGTISGIINGEEHLVRIGSTVGKQGVYHNHTPQGIKMFSPADIIKMLHYALSQPDANIYNGFLGMVGTEVCSTCLDGYKYHNYVIRFSGTLYELGKFVNQTNWDYDALDKDFEDREDIMRDNPLYTNEYGKLNSKGLQKLFFDTLKNMGIEGKISLQKVEDTGSVQNIFLDDSGSPFAVPCP